MRFVSRVTPVLSGSRDPGRLCSSSLTVIVTMTLRHPSVLNRYFFSSCELEFRDVVSCLVPETIFFCTHVRQTPYENGRSLSPVNSLTEGFWVTLRKILHTLLLGWNVRRPVSLQRPGGPPKIFPHFLTLEFLKHNISLIHFTTLLRVNYWVKTKRYNNFRRWSLKCLI